MSEEVPDNAIGRKPPNTVSGPQKLKLVGWLQGKAVNGVIAGTRTALAAEATGELKFPVVESNITTAVRDLELKFLSTRHGRIAGKPVKAGNIVRQLSRVVQHMAQQMAKVDPRLAITDRDMDMLTAISRAYKVPQAEATTTVEPQSQQPGLFDNQTDV